MSELRVDNIVDMGGSGAPQLRKGANVTGISTITQAVVGNATINAGGINATGIVTSSSNKFVGDFASGNITAGVMTATSSVVASNITINSGGVNASGIVSATSYQGSGANLTGIGLTIAPIIYSPTVGATNQATQPTIELSVNQRIKVGVGSISLRMVGAGSTVIETFGLGISTSATYTVTVSNPGSGNKYYFDGNLSYQPTLYPGGTYTFDQSAGTNATHPLRFATAADAAGSTEYTTGVETNGTPGSAGAYTRITVAADAPTPLYYYCTNHSGMGSYVNIGNNVSIDNDGTLPKLSFTPVSSLSGDSVIFVDIPSGSITTMDGTSMSATNWTFTTKIPLKLFTWGDNHKGQLGQNNLTKYSSPVQVGSSSGWNALTGEAYAMLATKDNGELWVMGDNDHGQLGQNNLTKYSSPVQIPGTTWNATNVYNAQENAAMCLKTDGTLWSWGYGSYGRGGHNDHVNYSSPVQIPGTTWTTAAVYGRGGGGIKSDGTLWMWGINNEGILGQNDRTSYSSPKQIPGTTWSKLGGGTLTAIALKTDGTAWTWGYNANGSLGQNSGDVSLSSPTQLGSSTDWSKISNGGASFMSAIKTDGTLWSWGYNYYGGQGQNNRTQYSSPVQVPGTTWSIIRKGQGYNTNMVIKTDGTMWGWGGGGDGMIGNNNSINISSPVQIPGTTWENVMVNANWTAALKQ